MEGFADDTLVRAALAEVAAAAGVEPRWHARIEKRIPVAAGLGGGSSDAATAIRLACELLDEPPAGRAAARDRRAPRRRRRRSSSREGPQLGTGTGATLEPVDLPQDYTVLLLLPAGAQQASTAEIYGRFDREDGFEERRARVLAVVEAGPAADLASLPPNDLAGSPLAGRLLELGRSAPTSAVPGRRSTACSTAAAAAERAASRLEALGAIWIATPAW